MADPTYSVKVSEETQDRVKSLVEASGMNNKEFFNTLLNSYELQKAKETTPIISADIEELETLTKRMNCIFINVSERINTLQRETKDEQEQQMATNQSTIELLQQRINGLERDKLQDDERVKLFIEDKERAEKHANDLQIRINELEQVNKNNQALNEEYKEKLDTQTSIVAEYRQFSDENKKLKSENAELMRKVQDFERENNILSGKLDEQSTHHNADIERLRDTLNIEREKSILELERKHQRELQELQAEYSKKLNEYETNVKSLLFDNKSEEKPPVSKPTEAKKTTSRRKKVANMETTEQDAEKKD